MIFMNLPKKKYIHKGHEAMLLDKETHELGRFYVPVLDSQGMRQLADWMEARTSIRNTALRKRKIASMFMDDFDEFIKFLRGE